MHAISTHISFHIVCEIKTGAQALVAQFTPQGHITQCQCATVSCVQRSKWSERCSVVFDSLWLYGLYSPWNSPGQNTRVGSLSTFQQIFPIQGSNPGLPHCIQVLYCWKNHKGSPRILERVAYPFSRRSSWARNWTFVQQRKPEMKQKITYRME